MKRILLVAMLCSLACPALAGAQAKVQGSTLSAPANYAYGCETRWLPGQQPPYDYEPITIGPSTCSLFNTGTTADNTSLVPASGTVLSARVKAGANPPQVSIATVRRYYKPNAQGQLEYTCCTGISETPPVQLQPNAITEIPVNFIVLKQPPENGETGYWDLVTVNVLGAGQLPVADLGPHQSSAGPDVPRMNWYFPKISPNDSNQNAWFAPNFEVLMQYDWCPKIAGAAPRAACPSGAPPTPVGPEVGPTPGTGTGTPPPGTATGTPTPASIAGSSLRLKRGKVRLAVTCKQAARCRGTVRLRTSQRKLLATRSLSIAPGKRGTVTLKLSKRSQRRVSKRGIRVRVEVDVKGAKRVSRTLTLRR